MSIQSEISRIKGNVAAAYEAVSEMGGATPEGEAANSENLAGAVRTGTQHLLASKQDTLAGLPGQVVGFGADGAALAVQGWSNPNLLDNWSFSDPINQRGQTEYYSRGYTIDRWKVNGASDTGLSVQLTSDGIVFKKSVADTYGSFCQKLENPEWLTGKTVTFSMLAKGNTDPYLLIYFNGENSGIGTTSVPLTDDWNLYTITRTITRSDITAVQISVGYQKADPVGSTIIRAAKFELGSEQTLAHRDEAGNWVLSDPPPNKALELAKCQRYFVRLPLLPYQSIGIAQGFAGTRARLSLYLPQPMRATPSLNAPPGDIFQLVESPASEATRPSAHLSTSATSLSNNILTLELNPQDGVSLSVGQTYIVRNKETSAYIDISSDL